MRDPVSPVSEQLRGALGTELPQAARHGVAGLSGPNAAQPLLSGRIQFREQGRNGARVLIAELVAGLATVGLNEVQPLILGFDVRRNAVAGRPSARKLVFLRHLQL